MKGWVIAGLAIAILSASLAAAITRAVEHSALNTKSYTPSPKPTMTVVLEMGDDSERWILNVPAENEPSWKNFVLDVDALKADTEGLLPCILFITRNR